MSAIKNYVSVYLKVFLRVIGITSDSIVCILYTIYVLCNYDYICISKWVYINVHIDVCMYIYANNESNT